MTESPTPTVSFNVRRWEGAHRAPSKAWSGRGIYGERWHGYLFIAPVFLFISGAIAFPLLHAFWSSLHRIRGLRSAFIGFGNYANLYHDEVFWGSLATSVRFTSACVVLHLSLGLGLALLLNRIVFAKTALRIAFLTPWMVAPAIGGTVWVWLLEPQFGVVNYLLQAIGLIDGPKAWLGEPNLAIGSVIVVDVWRGIPFIMLLMLAGLQTIPIEQYESASLDGATPWQQFRFVTLPNLRSLIVVASTLDTINTIKHYDLIAVMTGGGPAGATEVLPALLYNTAFRSNNLGQAAAVGVILLVLVLVLSVLYVRLARIDPVH